MFNLQFAGLTLDGVTEFNPDQPSRVAVERFPRRHGAIVSKTPFKAEKTISMAFTVDKASEAALKAYLDALAAVLDAGEGQLFLRDDNRFMRAVKTAFSYSYRAGEMPATRASGRIELVAADPFVYDGGGEKTQAHHGVVASPESFAATNSGGAITPPRMEIKAAGANKTGTFKLTNTTTGIYAQYTGTIVNGTSLVIDSSAYTLSNGGVNGLKDFVGSFWLLGLGVTNIEYSGPTGVDVDIFWTERWN
jgi:hypothetical protein